MRLPSLPRSTGIVSAAAGLLLTLARPEVSDGLRAVLGAWGPKAPAIAGAIVSGIGFAAHLISWLSHPPTPRPPEAAQ